MKLRGFESTITSADILWGLPGAGSFEHLAHGRSQLLCRAHSARGAGQWQALGAALFRGSLTKPGDNAVVHGVGHFLHASRDLFHP